MKIRVQNLRREFGKTIAVNSVSFEFESGQIYAFVGPNGAGKTTTMRIMATLDEPNAGDVFMDDLSVVEYPEKARHLIGFVPDELKPYWDTTVHEYLDFFARAYGLCGSKRTEAVASVEEFTNVAGIREKTLRSLSKGMKQRVSLGRALVADPHCSPSSPSKAKPFSSARTFSRSLRKFAMASSSSNKGNFWKAAISMT